MPSTFTLCSRRIALRWIDRHDAAALLALYSDPEVMRYWNHAPWTSMAQARSAIDEARADHAAGASLHCAIEHRATGVLIGSCALYAFTPQNRCASLGYLLSKAHWGQGYLSEVLQLLLEHAFTHFRLNRVEAEVHRANTASARALARLGFRHEGCLRERWIVDGVRHDTAIYGLLRDDWDGCTRRADDGGGSRLFTPPICAGPDCLQNI